MKFIYPTSKVKTETFISTCLFNTLGGISGLNKKGQCKLQGAKLAGNVAAAAQERRVRLALPNKAQDRTSPASSLPPFGECWCKATRTPHRSSGCLKVSGRAPWLQPRALIPDATIRQQKRSNLFIGLLKRNCTAVVGPRFTENAPKPHKPGDGS